MTSGKSTECARPTISPKSLCFSPPRNTHEERARTELIDRSQIFQDLFVRSWLVLSAAGSPSTPKSLRSLPIFSPPTCLAARMDQNWKEPIEGDLANQRPSVNLRQISGKSPGCLRDASGLRRGLVRQLAKFSFSLCDLPLRRSPVAISGISPESLRVDRLAGRMCSRHCSPRLKSSSKPPMCLRWPGGLATAAPFMARMEAFLGIIRSGDEIVGLPSSILAPGSPGSGGGTNARSNRRAIPRAVRGRPCRPLKSQVIACARGSDGR